MAKIRKPKKIMTMDKYTTAYDGYDVEGKIPRNTDGEEEILTPGQKSLVWEKKSKEVYTVNLYNITEDEPIETVLPNYYSEGDAIKIAIECLHDFDPTDDVIEATVFAGEYEDENGDVYGEPTDIYTISNQDRETTMQARKKAGYTQLEVNRYLGESLADQVSKKFNRGEISLDKAFQLDKKIDTKMSAEKKHQEWIEQNAERNKSLHLDARAIGKAIRRHDKNENYKKGRTMARRMNEQNGKMVEYEVPGFYGLYESVYTDEGELDYMFFDNPDAVDEHLMDLFKDFCDYEMDWSIDKKYVDTVGETYTTMFDNAIKDIIPSWKGSTYVETVSPREYNFTTDRVFAKTVIDDAVAEEIGKFLEKHRAEFDAIVKRRFTSRPGFDSFYSNDINSEDWQKELVDMDHNELSTIFGLILEVSMGDDYRDDLNYSTYEELRGNGEDYQDFLYNKNYDSLVNYINDNAVMKPALDDISELENYNPTGEEENGLPVYELDLHDQPGQQHLDFSKVESLNRRAARVLSESETTRKITQFQNDCYYALNNLQTTREQLNYLKKKYPDVKIQDGHFVLPDCCAVRIR